MLLEFFEANARILYPLLGVLSVVVFLLVLGGILLALRSQGMDGLQRGKLKAEIIHQLRRDVGGMSVEAIARAIGLESFKTVALLEEMRQDGLLVSYTNTQRVSVWRLKGVAG